MHADWERKIRQFIVQSISKLSFCPWPRAKLSINYAQNFKSYQSGHFGGFQLLDTRFDYTGA